MPFQGEGAKNMKEYFDLNIKKVNLEDMVSSCMSVLQPCHKNQMSYIVQSYLVLHYSQ